jgi:carbon-monoxide dehydrogenase large subunit
MLVGTPVKRVEDYPLVTGFAKFLDDLTLPNMVYAHFIRSPYAHARIKQINGVKALKEGALAFYSGRDIRLNPLPVGSVYKGSNTPKFLPLAVDKVRFVGEPVAVLVGADRYSLADLAELVEVEYEPLQPLMSVEEAVKEGAPLIHEEFGTNTCLRWTHSSGDVRQAFESADRVVKAVFKIQRLAAVAMEPRGVLASYDSSSKRLTIWLSSQTPPPAQDLDSGMSRYAGDRDKGFKHLMWAVVLGQSSPCILSTSSCHGLR